MRQVVGSRLFRQEHVLPGGPPCTRRVHPRSRSKDLPASSSSHLRSFKRRRFGWKRCFAPIYIVFLRCPLPNAKGDPNKAMTQHSEDERLAAASPSDVTLYTRPGCCLCEEAKDAITPLLREAGATLREVNIETDAVLEARYGTDIPVIFIGGRKAAKHRVDPKKFRRQLQESQRS
jgi:glutaredoxin